MNDANMTCTDHSYDAMDSAPAIMSAHMPTRVFRATVRALKANYRTPVWARRLVALQRIVRETYAPNPTLHTEASCS